MGNNQMTFGIVVLEHLRRIDHKVDSVREDLQGLGMRMSAVERHLDELVTRDVDKLG